MGRRTEDGWYTTRARVTQRPDNVRLARLSFFEQITTTEDQAHYYCADTTRRHRPLHGSYAKQGERIMRADNCVYCTARIISLHTGYAWDEWRTVDSVRPACIIEEDPI
ncbi:MAG TPA: hypothetical protein VFH56_02840 [Acidimicrobiales bacterium]|nr:hypothetical protein [Acidimicrobiales bacterium]